MGLDALSDRLMNRASYRNFGDHQAIALNHSVDVDNTDHAGIRWYEVRNPNAPVLYQQGTYAPDAVNRWMGSIAMDASGDMALGYSVSDGSSTFPGIRYTGRLAGDPAGILARGEQTLVAGTGVQTVSARWGDYTSMNIDPVDDCTFWYVNEYYTIEGQGTSTAGWQTRIASFKLPGCQ